MEGTTPQERVSASGVGRINDQLSLGTERKLVSHVKIIQR